MELGSASESMLNEVLVVLDVHRFNKNEAFFGDFYYMPWAQE